MKNYFDIPVPDRISDLFEPIDWAKKHCPSYITNDAVQRNGVYYYRFFFSNDRGLMLFALRWS